MKFKYLYAIVAFLWVINGALAETQKTVLAGGCFWCVESDFEKLDGVLEAISGFTGGTSTNPTYKGDHKGHYEAVEITYDPEVVSYQEILDYYWLSIDPFDPIGQFCDKGESYRSAIFVSNEEQRKIAEVTKNRVEDRFPNQTVATVILDSSEFYPIKGEESYHQDYYKNYSVRYAAYRWRCGRDKRTRDIWGEDAIH